MTHETDFNDSLDDLLGGSYVAPAKPASVADVAPVFVLPQAPRQTFPCEACHGTGKFRGYTGRILGDCHKCRGKGVLLTSSADRAKQRQSESNRKQRVKAEQRQIFAEAYPEVVAFIAANAWSDFVQTMQQALDQYGSLTDGQRAAIGRMMIKCEESRKVREEAKAASTKPLDVSGIARAFELAAANGKKRLALHLGDFVFKPAAATGRNPGAIYVTDRSDTYLGKAVNGTFQPTREGTAVAAKIVEEASSITDLESIRVRGINTGVCCCCGAELTNAQSIAAGIGPICASKWGI